MSKSDEWPDELDALNAAPQHHRLLLENELVRVLDTSIPAGETVPLHTHRWPSALYILKWSDFIRRGPDGKILVDSRTIDRVPNNSALWAAPLPPHTLENIGTSEFRAISIEIKTSGCRSEAAE